MNTTSSLKGEQKRIQTTGKITRILMENPDFTVKDVAKVLGVSQATVTRYWEDACYAVKLNKSRLRPEMTNPPRIVKVSGMDVHYTPQDYDNEFRGGNYRTTDLPDIYVYGRQDDSRLDSTYEVIGFEINWGCRGSVPPEKFEQWVALCSFVASQVRELESRLETQRRMAAYNESKKPE